MSEKSFLSRVPIPFAGVGLGFAALGNLLQSYSEAARGVCGAIAAIIVLLVLLRAIADFAGAKKEMENPIIASVSGTFCMALMLLAGYAKPFAGAAAMVLWCVAVCLHIVLILWFSWRFFVRGFDLKKVFASYYIVYVGIVVASVTAPAFGMQALGNAAFWFGLACLAVLLVLVSVRYAKLPQVPAPAQPIFCIYAAPTSLCVAGYVQSGQPKALPFALALLVVSFVLYLVALVRVPAVLKGGFFPSYAALTFPFVISAIASKQVMAMAAKAGETGLAWLGPVVLVQTVIAVCLCVYVLVRYCASLAKAPAAKAPVAKA